MQALARRAQAAPLPQNRDLSPYPMLLACWWNWQAFWLQASLQAF